MNINIEVISPYKIAYIRRTGPYGPGNVQIMEQLKSWAREKNLINENSIILGIPQDNPQFTEPKACRYDTCLVVSNDYLVIDDYVREGHIVGGKYAVFKINHTAEAVQKAWIDVFPELLTQGYKFDETRPIIERYIVKMVNNHYCEICVPVY